MPKFSFGGGGGEEKQKPFDNQTFLTPDEDLTADLNEAECRKALNRIARAGAHMFMAGSIGSEMVSHLEEKELPSPLQGVLLKRHMRRANELMEPFMDKESKLCALFPIFRL